MLSRRLSLWDVDDVEWLCSGIVQQTGFKLAPHEREDLLCYLIETAWELSLCYEPGRMRHGFRKYAAVTLRRRSELLEQAEDSSPDLG